jgi:hypothetical protein
MKKKGLQALGRQGQLVNKNQAIDHNNPYGNHRKRVGGVVILQGDHFRVLARFFLLVTFSPNMSRGFLDPFLA